MSNEGYMVGMIVMAIIVFALLVVGTMAAAGLLGKPGDVSGTSGEEEAGAGQLAGAGQDAGGRSPKRRPAA